MGSNWFHNLHRGGIPRVLATGIRARIFPGTHLMLSVVDLQPWSESPVHSHMNEQWGVCLEGKWVRIQSGREYRVKAGDFWQTPPHGPHGGRTLGVRCRILDIFAPPREEYRRQPARAGSRRERSSLPRSKRPHSRPSR
jgi:quercetin dioxygenase-like cupin family protein